MKKSIFLIPVILLFLLAIPAQAQQIEVEQNSPKTAREITDEEDGPVLSKFEPDFLESNEQRMAKIMHTRAILDTLDISDRKRRRLLRDLYKNGVSERLSKALLAETKFEDVEQ